MNNARGTFKATQPDAIEMTLTLTMPLGQWRELRDAQDKKYPGWRFAGLISRMIINAEANYVETTVAE